MSDVTFTTLEDGSVRMSWLGDERQTSISRELVEQMVDTHNELIAARKVVEAARKASALIGWDDGTTARKLDDALDEYDATVGGE